MLAQLTLKRRLNRVFRLFLQQTKLDRLVNKQPKNNTTQLHAG